MGLLSNAEAVELFYTLKPGCLPDFTGMTMFHCHILEHEDMGMMGVWNIQ
ncbi:multicopper oxidase domain-containing protein [Methylomonas sp. DH-1]|nr:multicopper oxidase domain-containing protein [Methylomonas sp. DH-1]